MKKNYVIGVDFGTSSVRAVLVDAHHGKEIASSEFEFPLWKSGAYCDAGSHQFRQHPREHIQGLETVVRACVDKAGPQVAAQVRAISVGSTGSTPIAVNKSGIPLAFRPGFEENPNAMFILWKDHTATAEAAEINGLARHFPVDYLQNVGGDYSPEWFWAKLLHVLRVDPEVREATYSFVEHCDWVPFMLTGGSEVDQMKRCVCAAGHKALYAEEFGGLPPEEFFTVLDPLLKGFRDRLYDRVHTADQPAGNLCKTWAGRFGLSTDVLVGIGAMDAHMGAVGGQIQPYFLSKVMGTSTCDMLVAPMKEMEGKLVEGICGQVPGSVIPGMMGMEAGQSAFGDVFGWFKDLISWPLSGLKDAELKKELEQGILRSVGEAAALIPLCLSDELALDWLNGRRTPDVNPMLQGAVVNLNLGSDAPRVFKALVESTCFGAKAIVDRFTQQGIPVKGLIGVGGVARKSPYIMQVMADVTGMPIRIHRSDQTCAAGAAMFAATVAKIYPNVQGAMKAMGQGFDLEYYPDLNKAAYYRDRYLQYRKLGAFVEHKPLEQVRAKAPDQQDQYFLIREQAYQANMELHRQGLVLYNFGRVSAADQVLGVFAIGPDQVGFQELTPEKMLIVDFDGNVVEGNLRPCADTRMHAVLYRHFKSLRGICQPHGVYATAWAQSLHDLPVQGKMYADLYRTAIPCTGLIGEKTMPGDDPYQLGMQIIECLKQRGVNEKHTPGILVGSYGPFTWGSTADQAVYHAVVLEQVAQMAFLTGQRSADMSQVTPALKSQHLVNQQGIGGDHMVV